MGWIRWTGKALEITGEVMQAEGFEEWAEKKGRGLVEKYASEEIKSFFKTNETNEDMKDTAKANEAKKDIRDTFKEFMNHAGFRNKLNKEITGFYEEFGDTFSYLESNRYTAMYYIYAIPRLVVHDRFDRRLADSLSGSGDIASLNERLAEIAGNIEEDFLGYFIPRLRNELMSGIESKDLNEGDNWVRLGQNWILIDCEITSRWTNRNDLGHYVGLTQLAMERRDKHDDVRAAKQTLSAQIFDVSAARRIEIVDLLNAKLKSGEKFDVGKGPREMSTKI